MSVCVCVCVCVCDFPWVYTSKSQGGSTCQPAPSYVIKKILLLQTTEKTEAVASGMQKAANCQQIEDNTGRLLPGWPSSG